MSLRSSPSFSVGMVPMEFKCLICGADVSGAFHYDARGVCEAHCFDHDYEYDRYRRDHFCVHCDALSPDVSYDDDVLLFGSAPLEPGEIFGTPLSEMNGNAAVANASPENRRAWDNWVAFCERNGHP